MISQKQFYILYNKNSPKNPNRTVGDIDARFFLRDMSLPIAYLFAKLNISANKITILFLLVSVLGNVILAIPTIPALIISSILFEFGQLLDCVDGQLARYYGTKSIYGAELDNISHIIIHATSMMALSWRVYSMNPHLIFLLFGMMSAFAFALDKHEHGMELKTNNESMFKRITSISWYIKQVDLLLEEIRYFSVILLIISIIEIYFIHLPFIATIFLIASTYIIIQKVFVKFFQIVKNANILEKKVWKGWDQQ